MDEWVVLFAVLAAIYLSECVLWVPRGRLVLIERWGRGLGVRFASGLFGSTKGGLVLASLVPPRGLALLTARPAVSIAPGGVLAHYAPTIDPHGPVGGSEPRFARFDDLGDVRSAGKDVLVRGEHFVHLDHAEEAKALAEHLRAIAAAKPKQRAKLIREALDRATDAIAIRARFDEVKRAVRPLRVLATAIFVEGFLVAPILVVVPRAGARWLPFVIGIGVLVLGTGLAYARTHRLLRPDARGERWNDLILLVSPPAAIRAHERAARRALASFHPVAAAAALARPAELAPLAARALRDLEHPIPPPRALSEEEAEAERWYRGEVKARIERALKDAGLDPTALTAAPAKVEPRATGYCPRCCAEYLAPATSCEDCGGIALVRWP